MKRISGFTLSELMVVLALIGGLSLIAMGPLRDMIRTEKVKGGANELFTALVYARGEAVRRNTCVDVAPVDEDDWSQGWTVQVPTTAGTPACGGAGTPEVLRTYVAQDEATIAGPGASINFNGAGRLTVLGDTSNGALCNNVCSATCTVNASPPSFRVQIDDSDTVRCVSVRSSGAAEVKKG